MSKLMMMQGNNKTWGLLESPAFCPSLRRVPIEERFDLLKSTMPRKLKVDSEKMTLGIIRTLLVTKVPIALGKMWRKISLESFAPKVLEAKTYSWPLKR